MNIVKSIVGFLGGECKGETPEQSSWRDAPAPSSEIKSRIRAEIEGLFDFVDRKDDTRSFDEVERGLRPLLFALARLLLACFLAVREERSSETVSVWLKKGYRRRKPERKYLGTIFGSVCFWRTYVRLPGGRGTHPLDVTLGLTQDGFSFRVMESCARLSTLVSYEQVTALSLYFSDCSPSKTTVEKAVLGLGCHTQAFFAQAPPPEGDGEVLVIQVDSKATPTATEEELEKRRQKRGTKEPALSPRHRGREKRTRRTKKRRMCGDKSKNGKATTIVTMYTLKKGRDKEGKPVLLGPLNKWAYASYAPKRHAFEVARREADKRGFKKGSHKTIQVVTDGDEDLECYTKELFPEATHTLDIVHVLEYLWEAGRFVFEEGSDELAAWVKKQERLLYRDKEVLVMQHVGDLSKQARPGATQRIDEIQTYLFKRLRLMSYGTLRKRDLEVASGAAEGAVRHVIAKRFDSGSMRWIRERAEALLQLRCIEINGDWAAFLSFVTKRLRQESSDSSCVARLLTTKPSALPSVRKAA